MRKSIGIVSLLLTVALLVLMAGSPSVAAAQAVGGPSVAMSLVSPTAQVRIDSPLPVKATFSEPVSGFTVEDIAVGNGAAGNFSGSDGDSVYTFEVTPDTVGTVTVEIAAGAAQDAGGDGNTAAPLLSLGIPYDDDGDGEISKSEAIASIRDYFTDHVAKVHVIGVIRLYFASTGPATTPGAPTGLSATANGQTQIDLSWSGPSDDGGAAITGYRIEVSADRTAWSDLVGDSGSTSTTHSHTGLTAGSTRHYRVSAINSAGAGRVSAIATGTTASPPPAGSPAPDRAALVALYNATDGADWTDNTNWLSDGPLDDWYGVTTDASGRVTRLVLNVNRLSGSIPAELGNLSNLESLYLSYNQLSGSIPKELGNLSSLESLSLTNNQLTAIPGELGNLSNLRSLSVSSNQLSGSIPKELGNLSSLESLSLTNNQLTAIPGELGNLSNLRSLSVSSNQLSGSIPKELGNLSSLESLSLANNQLTAIPGELGNLSNLRSLSVSSNRLSGSIPAQLGNLSSLVNLNLKGNQLSGSIPKELGNLSNLESLDLGYNRLSGSIPAELGNLSSLESLYLGYNQLTGCIPEGLRDVRSNDFSRLGLPFCGN